MMFEFIELIIYFIGLITFFAITFKVLRATNLESIFKKNKVFEIKAAYFIISIAIAHILSSILLKFYEWALLILQ